MKATTVIQLNNGPEFVVETNLMPDPELTNGESDIQGILEEHTDEIRRKHESIE